jgi:hypothetical protein
VIDPDLWRVLAAIARRLARIERTILNEGEIIMGELDERLDQQSAEIGDVRDSIAASAADVQRALDDLKVALGGSLSPEQRAKLDAVDQSLAGLRSDAEAIKTNVDTADPEPQPDVA